jgi:hypothetical protein
MARIKGCGTCWKPLAECICDEDETEDGTREDAGER